MNQKPRLNLRNLMVLTPSGFRPFVGIVQTHQQYQCLCFTFSDGSSIDVTKNHRFVTKMSVGPSGDATPVDVHAEALNVGDTVCSMQDGELTIMNIEQKTQDQATYELLEVGGNAFKTNNVISHNCEFISSDPLLIDSLILTHLDQFIKPPFKTDLGWSFWQHITTEKTYLLGVDPATGSGEDYTVMSLYDFSDLSLVAQYRTNTVHSHVVYASLKLVLNKIATVRSKCYFSIENNGVGEGMLSLYENDSNIPETSHLISEEGANRHGMHTTDIKKLRACLTLKRLIESGKIQVVNEEFLTELKSFVASKGSYKARPGATDDIVSSVLIVVRLLDEMVTYEQHAFDLVNEYKDPGDFSSDYNEDSEYDDSYQPDPIVM